MRTLVPGWKRIGLGALTIGIALIPTASKAQSFGPTGEVMTSPNANRANSAGASRTVGGGLFAPAASMTGTAANPFANPYLNPYLNPLMTNQTANPQNAALYFLAAQQMSGGIGSGRLSGSRGVRAQGGNVVGPPPRGSSNTPGSGASQFFNRSLPRSGRAAGYYGRQARHFPGISR